VKKYHTYEVKNTTHDLNTVILGLCLEVCSPPISSRSMSSEPLRHSEVRHFPVLHSQTIFGATRPSGGGAYQHLAP